MKLLFIAGWRLQSLGGAVRRVGAHAMSQGLMKSAGSIGTIKTALLASMKLAQLGQPAG